MEIVLWLLFFQGVIGAFDTIYYHEYKAKLPARYPSSSLELRLHACRDFLYAVLFGTLPFFAWQGVFAIFLVVIITIEIIITLWDFMIEPSARKHIGDVYPGERVTHAIMGILYGGLLANLVSILQAWYVKPIGFKHVKYDIPIELCWVMLLMCVGVFLSGARDLYASFGMPKSSWPWQTILEDTERN